QPGPMSVTGLPWTAPHGGELQLKLQLQLRSLGPVRSDLRITRVFACVADGFKARIYFGFRECCCWRSTAVDCRLGASRGAPRHIGWRSPHDLHQFHTASVCGCHVTERSSPGLARWSGEGMFGGPFRRPEGKCVMKVCIVGASGKLGQYMVQHALDRG